MAEETTKDLPDEKSPAQKLQEFLEKEGLIITSTPQFLPTNHNSFEITVVIRVQKSN